MPNIFDALARLMDGYKDKDEGKSISREEYLEIVRKENKEFDKY